MKKLFAMLLALVLCLSVFAGCGSNNAAENTTAAGSEETAAESTAEETAATSNIKVGFIFLHVENSTYDKNFMDAAKAVQQELGLTDRKRSEERR